jgi:exodeoxyribonuclease VII small subunit
MTEFAPLEGLSYEQAYSELEQIVAEMEASQRPLEETLALYERGQALAQHCAALLDKAELKVRQVSGENLVEFGAEGQEE